MRVIKIFILVAFISSHSHLLQAQYIARNTSFGSTAIRIYHINISSSELRKMLVEDGAGRYVDGFFDRPFVYKIVLQGGGGYYTRSLLRIILNKTPSFVIGRGSSDDNALYRVSIGNDTLHLFGFNALGWKDLTQKWRNKSVYVLLDSKWGTNCDTRLVLWLAFDSPLDRVIKYKLIKYKDSFKKFYIKAYQVFLNPRYVHVKNSYSPFYSALKRDNAEDYMNKFNGKYIYRIKIQGGGGHYSDCLLMLRINGKVGFAIAKGYSDANDNLLRTGIGKEVNHLLDVQSPYWVNVSSEIHRYFVVRLNSKWGTDNDSKIIIWLSSDKEINDLRYSISMYPDGLGVIDVTKYINHSSNISENSLSLQWSGFINLDHNLRQDFVKTRITPDGWIHINVKFNGDNRIYSQSLRYWNFGDKNDMDSVYIDNSSLVIRNLDQIHVIDNINFIKPRTNVNRYIGLIKQSIGSGQFYGEKVNVICWDERTHKFIIRLFEGWGELKQVYNPNWEIKILEPLTWYSFLPHSKQPYLPYYYTWDWEKCNLVNNATAHSKEYRSLLQQLYNYLEIAKENGYSKDIKDIQGDIQQVLKLLK